MIGTDFKCYSVVYGVMRVRLHTLLIIRVNPFARVAGLSML